MAFLPWQKLTNDYLLLQTTERSTVEMKLLPLVNNTYVVCMISTVNGPVPDSRIEFFTTNWEPFGNIRFIHAANFRLVYQAGNR